MKPGRVTRAGSLVLALSRRQTPKRNDPRGPLGFFIWV